MTDGVVALDSSGIEPRHVDAVATQTVAEMHIFRQELHVAEADARERLGNVLRDRLVALPRARIRGLVENAARRGLVAAEYDGNAQARHQALHLVLEAGRLAARRFILLIDTQLRCALGQHRIHDVPAFNSYAMRLRVLNESRVKLFGVGTAKRRQPFQRFNKKLTRASADRPSAAPEGIIVHAGAEIRNGKLISVGDIAESPIIIAARAA